MELAKTVAHLSAAGLEIAGILIIVILAIHAFGITMISRYRGVCGDELFRIFRHRLARGILLGLEFLVAADIINTVAIKLTFESVGVLAIVVLIRTLLSFTLELELTGRWPWQEKHWHRDPGGD